MRDARFDKAAALRLLKERGVVTATVFFSGGNDSGDVDGVTLIKADGTKEQLKDSYIPTRWNATTGQDEPTREQTPDEKLHELLSQPVWDEWGSFAGEFSVSGTVHYDVTAGTVNLKQSVSYDSYEDSEENL